MTLFFIRHGETDFNKQGRLMGQLDEPLDDDGIKQSEKLAHFVKSELKVKFQRIYSSPMHRAARTAEIINKDLRLPIDFRPELKERNFGKLAGKTWAEIQKETGMDLQDLDERLEYDYSPYGGESAQDVEKRLRKFIDELAAEKPCDAALVVTHYGIIELMYKITGRHRSLIGNDSVHEFTF